MRVLLVSANTATTPYPVYPLGMMTVAAAVREAGHALSLFDFLQHKAPLAALEEAVRQENPEVVGISVRNIDNVNALHEQRYIDTVRDIVAAIRACSQARIVLGGSGFSILPERILETAAADYGIVGEGEEQFVQFLARAQAGEWPATGTLLRAPRRLPGPRLQAAFYERDLLRRYLDGGTVASLQSKRGCPLQCVYCSYPALEGACIRARPPSQVVDDIERLVGEHGVKFLFFTDSVFNDDGGHYLELLAEMQTRKVAVSWSAFLKPSGLTPDSVRLMQETGLTAAELGSDAACDATLRGLRKSFTFADVVRSNDLFAERKIAVAHYFMFGGPAETPATVREGIENMRRLNCSAAFVFMGIRLLPDTELLDIARRQGVIAPMQDLLEPAYYLAPGLSRPWLEETLTAGFRDMHHVVFPPDAMDDKLRLLHKLGYAGSLWELLAPQPRPGPTP